jgi:hypothetical protein
MDHMERLSLRGEISANSVTTMALAKTFLPLYSGFEDTRELSNDTLDIAIWHALCEIQGGLGRSSFRGWVFLSTSILHLKSTYHSPGFVESFRLIVRTIGKAIGAQLFRDMCKIGPLGIFQIRT